jgi:hypothetical protein
MIELLERITAINTETTELVERCRTLIALQPDAAMRWSLAEAVVSVRGFVLSGREMVPREGIIRNHRHDEPLFVLRILA